MVVGFITFMIFLYTGITSACFNSFGNSPIQINAMVEYLTNKTSK